ncbi:MAG: ABC transporter ATP-binding protein [Chlorobi bacterium]|nr:MAG: ABC transporter ATP-binding protein [Bacteroidota bacterium]MBE2265442.1 ABC transporter ATP-binding protein [Flavobacteriales bacterium]MBL1160506.1 ABC transporter ATP-binding protein [Chlorobiota bacterium]MBW7853245.1 ABC transporter ATP-binding protein [Candidatus Kapabacteria bacterium]MCL4276415.1 ABC transporter ATP-binding protein/permease [Ignavibacteria bacterium]
MTQGNDKPRKASHARRLFRFLRPYTFVLAGAVLLTLTSSALGPLRPYLTQIAIDEHIATGDIHGLFVLVLLIFGFLLLQGALQYVLTLVMSWIGQKVLYDIRTALYAHVERLSLHFYDTNAVGRIITRVTSDVEVLNELFSQGVVMMISDIMIILWILFFMFQTSVELTLLTFLVLPFLLTAAFIFRFKVRKVYDNIRQQVARMNAFINEFITGISIVQLFRQEQRMTNMFAGINRLHKEYQDRSIMYYATFFPVVELLSAISLCIVLWYASGTILGGAMTVGILIAFTQFTEMFFRPVRDLTEKYNTLQSSIVASERIFTLFDTVDTVPDTPGAVEFTGLVTGIEFANVSFSYDGVTPILQNVRFTVQKGETVALVGATGAGKSTVISLMSRFYDYQRGEIFVNGQSIRKYSQESLRKRMAIVLQDVFLFSRTVLENITLDRPGISTEQVIATAKALGAHDFISALPNGYNTHVRERGAVLSVGQKQLISFCRALVANPEILILDEATANIDTNSEHIIEQSTSTLLTGRTSIVIAHRLSTIQRADRIVVLHHGEVAEVGTHNALLQANGLYAKLYKLQFENTRV